MRPSVHANISCTKIVWKPSPNMSASEIIQRKKDKQLTHHNACEINQLSHIQASDKIALKRSNCVNTSYKKPKPVIIESIKRVKSVKRVKPTDVIKHIKSIKPVKKFKQFKRVCPVKYECSEKYAFEKIFTYFSSPYSKCIIPILVVPEETLKTDLPPSVYDNLTSIRYYQPGTRWFDALPMRIKKAVICINSKKISGQLEINGPFKNHIVATANLQDIKLLRQAGFGKMHKNFIQMFALTSNKPDPMSKEIACLKGKLHDYKKLYDDAGIGIKKILTAFKNGDNISDLISFGDYAKLMDILKIKKPKNPVYEKFANLLIDTIGAAKKCEIILSKQKQENEKLQTLINLLTNTNPVIMRVVGEIDGNLTINPEIEEYLKSFC